MVSDGKFVTFRVFSALILREMSASYGRNPGGYIWAILEPLLGLALLTLLFSFFIHTPPLGSDFPLFYFTGLMPFLMYHEISSKTAHAIAFSKPLLFYPRVTFFDAALSRLILHSLMQLTVFYILFFGLSLRLEHPPLTDPLLVFVAIFFAIMLGFGVGMLNALLFALYPVWERFWSIINRPLFLISCIFFTFESVPQDLRVLLWINPLIHIVGLMRKGFYPEYMGDYISLLYIGGLALTLCTFGVFFLRRYHKKILNDL